MFQVFAFLVNLAVSIMLQPKPPKPTITPHDTNSIPVATSDKKLGVIFGTVTIKDANVVWYGDLYLKVLKKKGSKGK